MWSLALGLWRVPLCPCVGKVQWIMVVGSVSLDVHPGVSIDELLTAFHLG